MNDIDHNEKISDLISSISVEIINVFVSDPSEISPAKDRIDKALGQIDLLVQSLPKDELLAVDVDRFKADTLDLLEQLLPQLPTTTHTEIQPEEGPTTSCPICLEDLGEMSTTIETCSHRYCTECITAYVLNRMAEFNVERIPCPDTSCTNEIQPFQLESVLDKIAYERLLHLKNKKTENTNLDIIWCANPRGCEGKIFKSKTSSEGSDVAECPICSFEFCQECKRSAHVGQTCMENMIKLKKKMRRFNLFRRKKVEYSEEEIEAMTQIWKEKNTKKCPHCAVDTLRISGCSHIKCRQCGNNWQWDKKEIHSFLDGAEAYPTLLSETIGSREIRGKMDRMDDQSLGEHAMNVVKYGGLVVLIAVCLTAVLLPPYVVVAPYRAVKRRVTKKSKSTSPA
eukprot:TRINITY_DN4942_c0_g1_i1.p1 TRINITY_DN4942_c0_g1~~TRINITY_DN4942_c0_g1_i1.p1  ORF type:complete len:409 (+),score=88.29 TRINITY_DN4942_c0_g1_i1:39-1229(+)